MKTFMYIMLLLLAIAILLPREVKSDYIEPTQPVEVVEIPSWVKPEFVENYLLVFDTFGKTAPVMIKIARAESHFDHLIKNPSSSARGIFQILKGTFADPRYGCTGDVLNAKDNVECARKIYEKDGTTPWNASKHVWGL